MFWKNNREREYNEAKLASDRAGQAFDEAIAQADFFRSYLEGQTATEDAAENSKENPAGLNLRPQPAVENSAQSLKDNSNVENPDWTNLQKDLAGLRKEELQLLEKRTPEHPDVLNLQSKFGIVKRSLPQLPHGFVARTPFANRRTTSRMRTNPIPTSGIRRSPRGSNPKTRIKNYWSSSTARLKRPPKPSVKRQFGSSWHSRTSTSAAHYRFGAETAEHRGQHAIAAPVRLAGRHRDGPWRRHDLQGHVDRTARRKTRRIAMPYFRPDRRDRAELHPRGRSVDYSTEKKPSASRPLIGRIDVVKLLSVCVDAADVMIDFAGCQAEIRATMELKDAVWQALSTKGSIL